MTSFDPGRVGLLCFDVDGTLRDTDDQYIRRIVPWVTPIGSLLGREPERLARWLVYQLESPGTYALELLDRLHLDYTANQVGEFFERLLVTRQTQYYSIITGVQDMVTQLHRFYPMAIVSTRGQKTTMAFLDHFELTGYFQQIVTGQTCPRTKPHPDPVLWVADHAGISPANCVMVGDTTADIRAGKAAGAQTIGVLSGFGQENELRRAGADLIIPTTPDLLKIIF